MGKDFCTRLPVLIKLSNSWGSRKKLSVWSLIYFLIYTLQKRRIFLKVNFNFWINICTVWTLWTSWGRSTYWFGWRSVICIWIEGIVFDHRSSVGHLIIRIGYWLHRGCKICLVCYFNSILGVSGNFLWQFWCLSNSLINGLGFSSPHSGSSLTYAWSFMWDFIAF